MISNDFKCHMYNEHLILVKSLPLGGRLIQNAFFHDDNSTLIAAGIEGVFFYRLNYQCSSEKAQAHKLDPIGSRLVISLKLFKRLGGISRWVKKIAVDEGMDLLFAWSNEETSVYSLAGDLHFSFENMLEEPDDVINDLLYMPKYRYIVLCSELGKLVVYKWAKEKAIVTAFKGMDRAIRGLARHEARVN